MVHWVRSSLIRYVSRIFCLVGETVLMSLSPTFPIESFHEPYFSEAERKFFFFRESMKHIWILSDTHPYTYFMFIFFMLLFSPSLAKWNKNTREKNKCQVCQFCRSIKKCGDYASKYFLEACSSQKILLS